MAKMTYTEKKEAARNEAIDWCCAESEQPHSYAECVEAEKYFEKLGRKYGLLQEFRDMYLIG